LSLGEKIVKAVAAATKGRRREMNMLGPAREIKPSVLDTEIARE
jgi:hypothetical protein